MARNVPIFIDLVMDNGKLVRIDCPGKYEDELHITLNDAQQRGDDWSPRQFDGCSATYMGHYLDRVNMARVVGRMQ